MQDYLGSYIDRFELRDAIRLDTEVVAAELDPTGGWNVTVRGGMTHGCETISCDHLIVASGCSAILRCPIISGRKPCRLRATHEPEGEAGFAYIEPTRFDLLLQGPAQPLRNAIFDIIQATRQLRLRTVGLVPNGGFEESLGLCDIVVTDIFSF